jgi:hypothetical protein
MYADIRSVTPVCEPLREYFMFVWVVPCEGACWHVWRHDVSKGGSANIEGFLRNASNIVFILGGGAPQCIRIRQSPRCAHFRWNYKRNSSLHAMPCNWIEMKFSSIQFKQNLLTCSLKSTITYYKTNTKTHIQHHVAVRMSPQCGSRWAGPLLREYYVLKARQHAYVSTDKFVETCSMIDTSVKSMNTGINIVVYLVLIMDCTLISYHYRLCINVTMCHVTSLERARGPASPAWASLRTTCLSDHKTDVLLV